jgi:hypothetical protein
MRAHVTLTFIDDLKFELGLLLPKVGSRDRMEALARGLGWRTYAALKAAMSGAPLDREIDEVAFDEYLTRYKTPFAANTLTRAITHATSDPGILINHRNRDSYVGSRSVPVVKDSMLESFLTPDLPLAEFRPDVGSTDIVLVRIAPFNGMPILLAVDEDGDVSSGDFHPILRRVSALNRSDYSWETNEYRHVCKELGLDPDQGRPKRRTLCDTDIMAMDKVRRSTLRKGGMATAELPRPRSTLGREDRRLLGVEEDPRTNCRHVFR